MAYALVVGIANLWRQYITGSAYEGFQNDQSDQRYRDNTKCRHTHQFRIDFVPTANSISLDMKRTKVLSVFSHNTCQLGPGVRQNVSTSECKYIID